MLKSKKIELTQMQYLVFGMQYWLNIKYCVEYYTLCWTSYIMLSNIYCWKWFIVLTIVVNIIYYINCVIDVDSVDDIDCNAVDVGEIQKRIDNKILENEEYYRIKKRNWRIQMRMLENREKNIRE